MARGGGPGTTCRADETFGRLSALLGGSVDVSAHLPRRPSPELPALFPKEPAVSSLLLSIGIVFLAELGDKSQLMSMAFATRYKARQVILGVVVAALGINLVSVAIGRLLGGFLESAGPWIGIVAGALFVAFAVWTWFFEGEAENEDDVLAEVEAGTTRGRSRAAWLVVASAFVVAELGDKTMLATAALALQYDWLPVWIGSSIGLALASSAGVLLGAALGRFLSGALVAKISAGLFLVFGAAMIVAGVVAL